MDGRNWQEKIANNIGFFAVLIVVGIYVGLGIATLGRADKTIDEIISDAVLSLTLGLVIKNTLKQQGLIFGENSESFQATSQRYGETIRETVPHFHKLPAFVDYKNKEAFKLVRNSILERVGLAYNDFFDDNGKYIGRDYKTPKNRFNNKGLSKEDIAINKCLNLNLTLLVADDLMSDVEGEAKDPNYMGATKKQWYKKGLIKQVSMVIVSAVIFGVYVLKFNSEFDKGEMIWKMVQAGIFIVFGMFELLKGYQFMRGSYRNTIIKKCNLLEEAQKFTPKVPISTQNDTHDTF